MEDQSSFYNSVNGSFNNSNKANETTIDEKKTEKEETEIINTSNTQDNDNSEYQTIHFFCKRCRTVPIIVLQSYESLNYFCKCKEIINQPIRY